MSNTDALTALQHIQAHIEELNLSEGDYLKLSNNLKMVYNNLPQHEVPGEPSATIASYRRRITFADFENIATAFKAHWTAKEIIMAQNEEREVDVWNDDWTIQPLDEALTNIAEGYGAHRYFNYPDLLDDLVNYDNYYIISVDKVNDCWEFNDETSELVLADTVITSPNGNCNDLSSTILLLTNAPNCGEWTEL